MKALWLSLLAIAFLAGCSASTPVTVTNQSSMPINAVEISGSGFSERIGAIGPGESVSRRVQPRGESGLAVSFRAGGRLIKVPAQGYFEGGGAYQVHAVVAPDLTVKLSGELKY